MLWIPTEVVRSHFLWIIYLITSLKWKISFGYKSNKRYSKRVNCLQSCQTLRTAKYTIFHISKYLNVSRLTFFSFRQPETPKLRTYMLLSQSKTRLGLWMTHHSTLRGIALLFHLIANQSLYQSNDVQYPSLPLNNYHYLRHKLENHFGMWVSSWYIVWRRCTKNRKIVKICC